MRYKAIILGFIILIGMGIRLYKIDSIPRGYTFDEAGIIYDAWSISLWHRDQFAHFMPLSFQSFGDYKPPLMIYTLAGIYKIFGLHEVFVRYLSAMAGVGSILVIYWLALELFESSLIGLAAAMVVSFSPWSIQLSRIGYEQNMTFFLGLIGITLLVAGLKNPSRWWGAIFFMALSMYTFHTAKIVMPLTLLLFGLIYHKEIWKLKKLVGLVLVSLVVFLLPLFYSSLTQRANTRAGTLILFKLSSIPELMTNIGNQLSPAFWIGGWDATSIRHAVPGFGVIFWPLYLVLLITFFWAVMMKHSKQMFFLLGLVGVGLMPAVVSHVTPHVIRSQFTLIPVALLVGYGVMMISKQKFGRIVAGITLLLTLYQLGYYLSVYFGSYATTSAPAFQYGYHEAITAINSYKREGETIFVTDSYQQPYIYLLLYNRITPQQFLFGGLNQYQIQPIKWSTQNQKGLYLATPQEIPVTDPRVKTVIMVPNTNKPVLVVARNE